MGNRRSAGLLTVGSKDAEHKQCKSVGRAKEFEISTKFIHSSLAQSVERMTVNHDVAGSSPARGATRKALKPSVSRLFTLFLLVRAIRTNEFDRPKTFCHFRSEAILQSNYLFLIVAYSY